MPNQWYCKIMGEEIGPISDQQLRQMAQQKRLAVDDQIRKGLTGNWVPAERVKGLFINRINANSKMALADQKSRERSTVTSCIQYCVGITLVMIGIASISDGDATTTLLGIAWGITITPFTWDKICEWQRITRDHSRKKRWLTLLGGAFAAVLIGPLLSLAFNTASRSGTVIPAVVSYEIINQSTVPNIKRSLDIQLNRTISEDDLATIAHELKGLDSNSYTRTFIGYYLPGMKRNSGYWATTHFNPNLDVRILGLTSEQDAVLRQPAANQSREVIGSWIDTRPYIGHKVCIFKNNGNLYMEMTFGDGSKGKEKLVEKQSSLGRRFQKPAHSPAGDHWILDSRGDLQLHDNDGLISIATKI